VQVLERVQLAGLLERCRAAVDSGGGSLAGGGPGSIRDGGGAGVEGVDAPFSSIGSGSAAGGRGSPLDCVADWSQLLSLGEQQRLAFARLLLTAPRLALLDEATSALDTANEALLYQVWGPRLVIQPGAPCSLPECLSVRP
jgi:ABC-type uncharacterized transport system fused permease/ATPase subunit